MLWRGVTYYTEVFVGWIVFTRYLAMKPRPVAGTAEPTADTPAN
jgi:hypothetical protein